LDIFDVEKAKGVVETVQEDVKPTSLALALSLSLSYNTQSRNLCPPVMDDPDVVRFLLVSSPPPP
jgi:hypothetical protein